MHKDDPTHVVMIANTITKLTNKTWVTTGKARTRPACFNHEESFPRRQNEAQAVSEIGTIYGRPIIKTSLQHCA